MLRTSKIGGSINFRCGNHRFSEALKEFKYPNGRYRRQFEYYSLLRRESARQGVQKGSRREKQFGELFLDVIEHLREQMHL